MENRKANTPVALRKMIGGTMYCVRVHFIEDTKETMKDKIKRMLESDVKASQHRRRQRSCQHPGGNGEIPGESGVGEAGGDGTFECIVGHSAAG